MKKKFNIGKINIIKSIVIAAVIAFLIYIFYFDIITNINKNVEIYKFKDNGTFITLNPGDMKTYILSNQRCKFDEIDILINQYNNINLNIEIKDTLNGENVYNKDITNDYIKDENGRTMLLLNLDRLLEKGEYNINIRNTGIENVDINVLSDAELNANIVLHSNLGYKIALFILFIIIIYLIIIFKFIDFNKIELHNFFLITIIPLGLICFILFAPWSNPDSGYHYAAIYRFSNILLGYSGENEWKGRQDDSEFFQYIWGQSKNPSMQSYVELVHNFNLFTDKTKIIDMPFKVNDMKYYSFVNYWPQIIGMIIARLLHLSAISSISLSRIMILGFYIWACYHAIKRTPIAKSIFLLVTLLPVTLMLSSGITYDVMLFITTLNFISSIFVLYKNKDSKRDIIEASIWAFMIGAVKGGGYLLLLPLLFILIDSKKDKKNIKNVCIIILSGISSIILFNVILQWNNHLFQFGVEGNGKMSASYALHSPIMYMQMCIKTYFKYFNDFVFGMLGSILAWNEFTLSNILIIFLILPMIILAIVEKDEIRLKNKDKWEFLLIISLVVIFTPMMLLSWTDVGSEVIEGIQGRYYLPIAVIIFSVITKFLLKEIKIDEEKYVNFKTKCLQFFVVLLCICIYFIERLYLLR